MELSRAVTAQLIYDFDFKEWAEQQELRDPFEYERKKRYKTTYYANGNMKIYVLDDNEIEGKLPTNAEKTAYRMIDYMFILDKIFAEIGYEEALDRAQLWNEEIIWQYFETLKPCESAERQCDMRCRYFLECEEK
jgi:hypothetical protein